MAEPVGDRLRGQRRVRLAAKPFRFRAKLLGVAVGAGDVRACGLAAVQARRARRAVCGVVRIAKRPSRVVVAGQVGVSVLENGQRRIGQQGLGLPGRGEDAAEAVVFLAGRVDQAAGRRAGDPFAVLQGVMDLAEVLGDRPGGLQVQELVDAVALTRAVALADQRPQVPVLDREGNQSAGPAGDVPSQGAAEPGGADMAVRVGRDGVFPAGPGGAPVDPAD